MDGGVRPQQGHPDSNPLLRVKIKNTGT